MALYVSAIHLRGELGYLPSRSLFVVPLVAGSLFCGVLLKFISEMIMMNNHLLSLLIKETNDELRQTIDGKNGRKKGKKNEHMDYHKKQQKDMKKDYKDNLSKRIQVVKDKQFLMNQYMKQIEEERDKSTVEIYEVNDDDLD